VQTDELYEGMCKLILEADGPSSRPNFCNLRTESDGGGDMGGWNGDLGGDSILRGLFIRWSPILVMLELSSACPSRMRCKMRSRLADHGHASA
jgi:hypothetical protein